MFRKEYPISAPTPAELEAKAQSVFDSAEIARSCRKSDALSSFRVTVQELRAINEDLDDFIATADQTIKYYTEKREAAIKVKADNEAIASRIIEIIGE